LMGDDAIRTPRAVVRGPPRKGENARGDPYVSSFVGNTAAFEAAHQLGTGAAAIWGRGGLTFGAGRDSRIALSPAPNGTLVFRRKKKPEARRDSSAIRNVAARARGPKTVSADRFGDTILRFTDGQRPGARGSRFAPPRGSCRPARGTILRG